MATHLQLAEELFPWEIRLRDGRTIKLLAHSYGSENHEFQFTVYFEGKPLVPIVVARVPDVLVESITGGPE